MAAGAAASKMNCLGDPSGLGDLPGLVVLSLCFVG